MKDLWVFIAAVSALFILLTVFIISFTMIFLRRRKEHQAEKTALKVSYQEALLKSRLEIQEQTLKSISQELHDNLGQVASLIKINLNLISLEKPGKSSETIEETKTLTRQLITDLRGISANLNGTLVAKMGLINGIENEVERLKRLNLFNIQFSAPEQLNHIDDQKAVILLRMVQEMLNNIIKHSEARNVSIAVVEEDSFFSLLVKDDGHGFDLEAALLKGGSGLHNLKDRAKLINAKFNIQTDQSGTEINIKTTKEL